MMRRVWIKLVTKRRTLVDCSGWSTMDMLRFMYFRENPMGMTHAHTHSATIMNCNDKEAYRFLLNKVFSITFIDRALIVKNYIDNELVKYHPHLAPIIWWYNALLYRFYWPYSLKKAEKIYADGLALFPEQSGRKPGKM